MNAQNAHLFLPLVQALADGKTIQFVTFRGYWVDCNPESDFKFNGDPSLYRIKPEPPKPREYRLWVTANGHAVTPTNCDSILTEESVNAGWSEIIVREVLPEKP